jgi:two-component system response regulator AtoC
MNGPTVLIVDDERTLARAIRTFLSEQGYEAEVAEDAEKALDLLGRLHPDVVFTDVRLPGIGGVELLKRIREFDSAISVVVMTAFGSIEGAVEALKLGAFDYVKKPLDLEEIKLLADRARETSLLKQELSYYRQRAAQSAPFEGMVGTSAPMRALQERVRQIAALDEAPPVLITGETGTGKGLVARTIHSSGPRRAKPFIEVNCNALPASLMEAELFGHERGAFTDAKESKVGLFEAAEGGFIFLDEVGDIELALQGKLLRAIEDRVVRRVGGVRDRKIDVRILAATNRELDREVQREGFRKDLYFRLAVILLRLPPLRERGEDVLLLAEYYLQRFNDRYGRQVRTISAQAQQLLLSYPWPGNVRELSHVIERAVIWSRGDTLDSDHLSLMGSGEVPYCDDQASAEAAVASAADAPFPSSSKMPPPGIDLPQWERSIIQRALREADGNQTKAAQRLGLSRDTLRYRLKKFGIQG